MTLNTSTVRRVDKMDFFGGQEQKMKTQRRFPVKDRMSPTVYSVQTFDKMLNTYLNAVNTR